MVKSIIYLQNNERYVEFFEMFQNEFENIVLVGDYGDFESEIIGNSKNITLVFIESALIKHVSDELSYILNQDNFICSLLTENPKELEDFIWPRYFEYYLDINNEIMVCTLFVRIRKNLNQRMKAVEYNRKISKFYEVAKYLPAKKDIEELLELTINCSMEISSADAASIFLVIDKKNENWSFYNKDSDAKLLKFMIAKNDSVKTELKSMTLPISRSSIVGFTVINGESILIDDAYNMVDELEYKFDYNFDNKTGYRTKSILSIPMKDSENRVLGVLQLLNKRDDHEKEYENNAISFDADDEKIIFALLGQSAVSLENIMLIKDKNEVLQKYRQIITEVMAKLNNVEEDFIDKKRLAQEIEEMCRFLERNG